MVLESYQWLAIQVIRVTVGQGPTELAVGAGEWIFIILPIVFFFLLISGMDG